MLKWFDAREATEVGTALANDFLRQVEPAGARKKGAAADPQKALQRFLQSADRVTKSLRLNVFQRAQLANSFKWRLIESGTEKDVADELTRALVVRLGSGTAGGPPDAAATVPGKVVPQPKSVDVQALLQQGMGNLERREYAEAARAFRGIVAHDPGDAAARNNLGVALLRLGRYAEAEEQFRRAIKIKESYADAHSNLGNALRARGLVAEAEEALRRALKHKPGHVDAQLGLAGTLMLTGRWSEAKELTERALRTSPRSPEALTHSAQIARGEGNLAEAEEFYRRASQIDPRNPGAWAGLAGLRRMTHADADWLKHAEDIAGGTLAALEEAELRYAMGKFCDDVGDYKRALRNYKRANELQKNAALPYDRDAHARLVNDLKSAYGAANLASPAEGASESELPVLVVGLPRSGTSLVEQIIGSHPQARGAGELGFWSEAMQRLERPVRAGTLDAAQRRRLATDYLKTLASLAPQATRVVDKATCNAEYLGVIHTIVPKARFIYLARDPIDACLSCYFNQMPQQMSFSMDLADLAHYYREHHRLVEHWRSVLPAGTLLDVPYAALVADPEGWSRRILEFLGLPWNPQVLEFHQTARTVLTPSFWQVRQPIFRTSVGRWHNYEKFIGPLQGLRDSRA